tara:strand:+ start:142 stop:369 length:228 start_codon:yes stop_codon:yes gene_type:complete
MKEKKQKIALDRVIRQSFAYQKKEKDNLNRRTIENMMKWNKQNLSPTGGKLAFRKTQKELMTPKHKSGWLSKDEE